MLILHINAAYMIFYANAPSSNLTYEKKKLRKHILTSTTANSAHIQTYKPTKEGSTLHIDNIQM
jgi:hypothetical protein